MNCCPLTLPSCNATQSGFTLGTPEPHYIPGYLGYVPQAKVSLEFQLRSWSKQIISDHVHGTALILTLVLPVSSRPHFWSDFSSNFDGSMHSHESSLHPDERSPGLLCGKAPGLILNLKQSKMLRNSEILDFTLLQDDFGRPGLGADPFLQSQMTLVNSRVNSFGRQQYQPNMTPGKTEILNSPLQLSSESIVLLMPSVVCMQDTLVILKTHTGENENILFLVLTSGLQLNSVLYPQVTFHASKPFWGTRTHPHPIRHWHALSKINGVTDCSTRSSKLWMAGASVTSPSRGSHLKSSALLRSTFRSLPTRPVNKTILCPSVVVAAVPGTQAIHRLRRYWCLSAAVVEAVPVVQVSRVRSSVIIIITVGRTKAPSSDRGYYLNLWTSKLMLVYCASKTWRNKAKSCKPKPSVRENQSLGYLHLISCSVCSVDFLLYSHSRLAFIKIFYGEISIVTFIFVTCAGSSKNRASTASSCGPSAPFRILSSSHLNCEYAGRRAWGVATEQILNKDCGVNAFKPVNKYAFVK